MKKQGLILAAIGAAAFGSAGALVWEGGPDVVIFPTQQIPIFFNHDYHVRKPNKAKTVDGEGLACEFCHEKISGSKESSDRDIPGHGACDSCHAEWIGDEKQPAPQAGCAKCHKDLENAPAGAKAAPLVIPAPHIRFAHKSHLDAGVKCVNCHENVPKKTVATRDDYPTMDRCIACHEKSGASTECRTCHETLPSGRLALEYPEGTLKPNRYHSFMIHDADFLRDHAVPAQRDKALCAKCHGEDYCLRCHDGSARDVRYHPGDWISMHGIRAKTDDYRCQSCHRLQTFCLDCHVRTGVATVGISMDAYGPGPDRNNPAADRTRRTVRSTGMGANLIPVGPHPMAENGWLTPSSRNFHGFFAQRNIQSCASCHQEQLCITCHSAPVANGAQPPAARGRTATFNNLPVSVPSFGGNPHGPNPQRLRGSTARNHNARMCLKCHSPADPLWR